MSFLRPIILIFFLFLSFFHGASASCAAADFGSGSGSGSGSGGGGGAAAPPPQFEKLPPEEHAALEKRICEKLGHAQTLYISSPAFMRGQGQMDCYRIIIPDIEKSCDYSYTVLYHAIWYGFPPLVEAILLRSSLNILTDLSIDVPILNVSVDPKAPIAPVPLACYMLATDVLKSLLDHYAFLTQRKLTTEPYIKVKGESYRAWNLKKRIAEADATGEEPSFDGLDDYIRMFSPNRPIDPSNPDGPTFENSAAGEVLYSIHKRVEEGERAMDDRERAKWYGEAIKILVILVDLGEIGATTPVVKVQEPGKEFVYLNLIEIALSFNLLDLFECFLECEPNNKLAHEYTQEQVMNILLSVTVKNKVRAVQIFDNDKFSYLGLSLTNLSVFNCTRLLYLNIQKGQLDLFIYTLKALVTLKSRDEVEFQIGFEAHMGELTEILLATRTTHSPTLFWNFHSRLIRSSLIHKFTWALTGAQEIAEHGDLESFIRLFDSDEHSRDFLLSHWGQYKSYLKRNKNHGQSISDFMRQKISEIHRKRCKERKELARQQKALEARQRAEEETIRKAMRLEEKKRVLLDLKSFLDFLLERPDNREEKKLAPLLNATGKKRDNLLKRRNLKEAEFEALVSRLSKSPDCRSLREFKKLHQSQTLCWEEFVSNPLALRTVSLAFFSRRPWFFAQAPFRFHSDEERLETLKTLRQSLMDHYEKESPKEFFWSLPFSKDDLLMSTRFDLRETGCYFVVDAFIQRDGILRPFLIEQRFTLKEVLNPQEVKPVQECIVLEEPHPLGGVEVLREAKVLDEAGALIEREKLHNSGGGSKEQRRSAARVAWQGAAIMKAASAAAQHADELHEYLGGGGKFSYKDPHTVELIENYYTQYEEHVSENNRLALRTVFDFMLANPDNSPFTLVNENDRSIQFRCFHKSSGIREVKSGKASIFWTYEDGVFRVIAIGSHKSERSYNIDWVNEDWVEDTVGSRIPSGVYSIQ